MLSAIVGLSGCGDARECRSLDGAGIVGALEAERQFRTILTAATQRTQTFAMAAKRDGAEANEKLADAIEAAVERHGSAWTSNVEKGWATLDPAELRAACSALKDKDREKFEQYSRRIGPAVRAANLPVLKRAGAEVLRSVWEGQS